MSRMPKEGIESLKSSESIESDPIDLGVMRLRIAIVIVLLVPSSLTFGSTFDFSFNDSAGALKYSSPIGETIPIHGNADFQTGVLADKANNYLFEAGILLKGDPNEDAAGWLAVGGKALAGLIHNYLPGTTQDAESLMIGGELGYIIPAAKRYSAAFYDYFGPGVTSFGVADRAYQWGAHLDYDLNSGAKIYVEYREIDFRIRATGRSATLDSGIYVGIKLGLK